MDKNTYFQTNSPSLMEFGMDLFSETRINEIQGYIIQYFRSHRQEMEMVGIEIEDFTQDILTNLCSRNGYKTFDKSKVKDGSLKLFIFRVAKNYLIDLKRKKFRGDRSKYKSVPIEKSLNENGFSLSQILAAPVDTQLILLELADSIPNQQISPNYYLSWRELFEMTVKKTADQISELVGISVSRVKQLQKELYDTFVKRYLLS